MVAPHLNRLIELAKDDVQITVAVQITECDGRSVARAQRLQAVDEDAVSVVQPQSIHAPEHPDIGVEVAVKVEVRQHDRLACIRAERLAGIREDARTVVEVYRVRPSEVGHEGIHVVVVVQVAQCDGYAV